ncbi:MAG: hypothetical protein CSA96_03910 [Bacteroidetes bacterium]|nr:MAG: hypothetical protein CSA96_03910 [Bacteroidota bacterium]
MKDPVTSPGEDNRLPPPHDAWLLLKEEKLEIVRLDIPPGKSLEPHSNPWRILFFVHEGRGMVSFKGQKHELDTGQLVLIEKDIVRQWSNPSDQTLKLLVVKLAPDS